MTSYTGRKSTSCLCEKFFNRFRRNENVSRSRGTFQKTTLNPATNRFVVDSTQKLAGFGNGVKQTGTIVPRFLRVFRYVLSHARTLAQLWYPAQCSSARVLGSRRQAFETAPNLFRNIRAKIRR